MPRGRPRLAAEIKEQNGHYRHDAQRRNKDAPVADGREPVMPEFFNDDERKKWIEIVEDLRRNGILSSDLRELITSMCVAWGGYMTARRNVEKYGQVFVFKDSKGEVQVKNNPFSIELHKYRAAFDAMLPELGLTPSSRQRMVAVNAFADDDDPFKQLLSRLTDAVTN